MKVEGLEFTLLTKERIAPLIGTGFPPEYYSRSDWPPVVIKSVHATRRSLIKINTQGNLVIEPTQALGAVLGFHFSILLLVLGGAAPESTEW